MHFNFHLSGDESPEQSRRIANAVLALGGLLKDSGQVNTLGVFIDQAKAADALGESARRLGKAVEDLNAGPTPRPGARWVEEDEPTAPIGGVPPDLPPRPAAGETVKAHVTDAVTGRSRVVELPVAPPSPVAAVADALREKAASEQFPGALTAAEISAVESLPPAPPVPPTPASSLDKHGLPWDERIHSGNRKLNADGTWRYRKNVPDETKQAVEAELRGLVQAPHLTEADLPLAAPPIPVILPPGSVTDVTPPIVPAPPVPTRAPPVPTSSVQRTYSDVVNLIMAARLQPETYVAVIGMSLPDFATHVITNPQAATDAFNTLDRMRSA